MHKPKIITILVFLLTCSVGVNAYETTDSVDVSTYSSLISAVNANKKYIHLTADISMTNLGSAIESFSGEIDGLEMSEGDDSLVCHTLSNLSESFFVTLSGAYIHNLKITNSQPEWHATSINEGMGVICRNCSNSKFENIHLDNVKVAYTGFWQGSFINFIRHYNGGIAVGKANSSTFKNIYITNSYVYVTSTEGGGVVGDSYDSSFENVTMGSSSAVHVQGGDNLVDGNAGGFAGRAENCTFKSCVNSAMVSCELDNVGGIAGKATSGSTFTDCENRAFVGHLTIDDPDDISSYISNYSLTTIASILPTTGSILGTEALETQYIRDWMKYNTLYDQWKFEYNEAATILDDQLTAAGRELAAQKLEAIEARKPVEPVKAAAKTGMSTAATIFSYALLAAQVAQLIYEAQDEDDAGGIVGRMNDGGSIIGCANYGIVRSDDAFGGGIVGETTDGVVINHCYNAGQVQGYEQTGGIVGKASGGKVISCLNTGNINNGNSDKDSFGQICGDSDGASFSHNCYLGETDDSSSGNRAISTSSFISGTAALYMNEECGDKIWRQTIGTDFYPSLDTLRNVVTKADIRTDLDDVFHVSTSMELMQACSNPYAKIVLDNDINVGSHLFKLSSEFMPFRGTINGQGYKISDISYTLNTYDADLFKNDNHESRVAFFPFARNAVFRNLTLDDFKIYIGGGEADYTSLLVADSQNCTYDSIHITGNSYIGDWDGGYTENVSGLIGLSQNDNIANCSVGGSCQLNNASGLWGILGSTRPVAGLIANAVNSTITQCYSSATLYGNSTSYAAGIVASATNSNISRCLNTGSITAEDYIGGIVGEAYYSNVDVCVNTGTIKSTNNSSFVAGVLGYLYNDQKACTLAHCYNFGTVTNTDSGYDGGAIYGGRMQDTGIDTSSNFYYCQSNGSTKSNVTDSVLTLMKNGGYAYNYNKESNDTVWYQAIDANYSFPTAYFAPIPDAGIVYADTLCDASNTVTYSNKYHAALGHEQSVTYLGICQECGNVVQAPDKDALVHLVTATDLMDFATLTNKDGMYSSLNAQLESDIDLDGCDFPTIGSLTYPYKGQFNGRGHRIKNMELTAGADDPCGFFSCLGDSAVIDSLIIDKTSSITGEGYGVAGIAGITSNSEGATLIIRNCGNEATIEASRNAAGILGCVSRNYSKLLKLTISGCYNVGTIDGDKESASICAWTYNTYNISNCYNGGTVNGRDSGKPMYRYAENSDLRIVSNCYDINDSQEGVKQTTLDQITSGKLCWLLNGSQETASAQNGYYQRLDSLPTYPELVVDTMNLVNRVLQTYCNAKNDTVFYNPNRNHIDGSVINHKFDDEGFCTLKEGETHYLKPDSTLINSVVTYQISKPGHLYWVAARVNDGFGSPNCILMNDIMVNDTCMKAVKAKKWNVLRQWTPIGTETYQYENATFNGNSHVISGLYCPQTGLGGAGLFGYAYNGAVIKNVGVIDSYIWGSGGVGAIIGWGGKSYSDNSTWTDTNGPSMYNCFSTGEIGGGQYMGGLIGYVNNGTLEETNKKIYNCYSYCDVENICKFGALIGYLGDQIGDVATDMNHLYWDQAVCPLTTGSTGRTSYGTDLETIDFAQGKVCDLLNSSTAGESVKWSQDLATQSTPYFGDGGVYLSRTVDQKWGTVVLPFTVYSDTTIAYFQMKDVYKKSEGIGALRLKRVDQVAANTPCFFYNRLDTSLVVFRSDGREVPKAEPSRVTIYNGNLEVSLNGTYETKELTPNLSYNYSFLTNDTTVWRIDSITASKTTVEPYHCYIDGPECYGLYCINMEGGDFDFNDDGVFDKQDVQFIYEQVTSNSDTDYLYDANNDGKCTMSDVTIMIKRLLDNTITLHTPPTSDGVITAK